MIVVEEGEIVTMIVAEDEETKTKSRFPNLALLHTVLLHTVLLRAALLCAAFFHVLLLPPPSF